MTRREIRKLVKRLGIGRSPRPAARRPFILLGAAAVVAAGLLLLPRTETGPAYRPPRNPAETAQQRARLAQELYASLTPFQRATLDRFEPVVIGDAAFTPEQRRRAWQLAQVGDGRSRRGSDPRITAVFERVPADGIAPGDEVHCTVRMRFDSQESPVAYRTVASAASY